jgi:PleD family two-component response regulator
MLEHYNSCSGENTRGLKLILLVVNDERIGSFLVRVIRKETAHHVMLAAHEQQALKMSREIKPDLFLLDYELDSGDSFALYDQLHTTKGLEEVPALLWHISTRFPRHGLKQQYFRNGKKSAELEEFLHALQEVLA